MGVIAENWNEQTDRDWREPGPEEDAILITELDSSPVVPKTGRVPRRFILRKAIELTEVLVLGTALGAFSGATELPFVDKAISNLTEKDFSSFGKQKKVAKPHDNNAFQSPDQNIPQQVLTFEQAQNPVTLQNAYNQGATIQISRDMGVPVQGFSYGNIDQGYFQVGVRTTPNDQSNTWLFNVSEANITETFGVGHATQINFLVPDNENLRNHYSEKNFPLESLRFQVVNVQGARTNKGDPLDMTSFTLILGSILPVNMVG